jgi:Holliday junction resolvase-like predicted endonuclease/predicted transcriptional regulator
MRTDREIILSVLKLTQKGLTQKDHVARDAQAPMDIANEVLRKLDEKGLIKLNQNKLTAASKQRLELAIEAIKQGADPQRTCRFLEWKEFENITAATFETNGYAVKKNVHFKAASRRWEIDLIACRQPRIVCVDCKHWQHGWSGAAIGKTVDAQIERTKAFEESLQNFIGALALNKWTIGILIPVVITLTTNEPKIHSNTPVVPILQLQNFINELPAQSTLLTHFSRVVKEKNRKLTEF